MMPWPGLSLSMIKTAPGGQDKPGNERLVAVLTENQVRRWKAMTGAPAKVPIAPFGSPEARTQP